MAEPATLLDDGYLMGLARWNDDGGAPDSSVEPGEPANKEIAINVQLLAKSVRVTIEEVLARQTGPAFISTADLERKIRVVHCGYLADHNELGSIIAEAALRRRARIVSFAAEGERRQ